MLSKCVSENQNQNIRRLSGLTDGQGKTENSKTIWRHHKNCFHCSNACALYTAATEQIDKKSTDEGKRVLLLKGMPSFLQRFFNGHFQSEFFWYPKILTTSFILM